MLNADGATVHSRSNAGIKCHIGTLFSPSLSTPRFSSISQPGCSEEQSSATLLSNNGGTHGGASRTGQFRRKRLAQFIASTMLVFATAMHAPLTTERQAPSWEKQQSTPYGNIGDRVGAKRRVPPNFGLTIKITRLKRQTGIVAAQSTGSYGVTVAQSALNALCSQYVSGTLAKYRGVYGNSDIALLTTLGDPTEFAIRDISRDLALQMDTAVRASLSAVSNGTFIGAAATAAGSLTSTTAIKMSDIIKAVAKLRAANNPRWPDGNFPLIFHPLVTYDLKATLSSGYSGAWQDIHKYGTTDMAENLYRGEIGRIYGARLVESTNVKRLVAAAGMSAGTSGYQNLLLAPEAYYVCEMDQMTGRVIVKGLGSSGALDADNSLSTVAAKVFFCSIRGFQGSDPNTNGNETRYCRVTTGSTL